MQVLWRDAVATVTVATRRNKGVWSSLGIGLSLALSINILGDSLSEILGDTLSKYGASLRE